MSACGCGDAASGWNFIRLVVELTARNNRSRTLFPAILMVVDRFFPANVNAFFLLSFSADLFSLISNFQIENNMKFHWKSERATMSTMTKICKKQKQKIWFSTVCIGLTLFFFSILFAMCNFSSKLNTYYW